MRRLTIALAAAAAVLALAACGGDGYESANRSPAVGSGDDTGTVSVAELGDAGRVLVDSAGRALYTADEEADTGVVCTGACTSFWTPLTVAGGAPTGSSLPGELGVVERGDGTRQVTLDGQRLYTFASDEPGQVMGDGLSDSFDGQRFTWHVVSVGDTPGSNGDDHGSYGY